MTTRTLQRLPALLAAALLGLTLVLACAGEDAPAPELLESGPAANAVASDAAAASAAAELVGGGACVECHEQEARLWTGSDHDLAMQVATDESVLGDFDDASYTHFGVTSTFTRRDGAFVVRTDGPDGQLADFEVLYTFGFEPLQQYIVEFPDGRLQCLLLAWDSRARLDGGQRWFHLYPSEPIPSVDELHWTRRRQNWNFACAECHSTALVKGYDAETDRYETTWAEINVSCEACHGPGSRHVEWARAVEAGEPEDADPTHGLALHLKDTSGGGWVMDGETGIAARSAPREPDLQMDTCARCHSRRRTLTGSYQPDTPFLDTHVPEVLADRLYHADGQILDEVYVWGSFVQSKMHRAGVRCTDCHDAHSNGLLARGNDLCNQCHLRERFDTIEHSGHEGDGPGTQCVDCHMPETTYMVVDPRRDHGFRVPRPDLTAALGIPNACSECHSDHDLEWVFEAMDKWYPERKRDEFASTLAFARAGDPRAPAALAALAGDAQAAPIVRATALHELGRIPGPTAFEALARALDDDEDLLRLAGVRALAGFPREARVGVAARLLDDPRLAVRIEAARSLADVSPASLPGGQRAALVEALAELEASERFNADTPEAHLNLGLLREGVGRLAEAEAFYRQALRLDAQFAPASINLSDLLRRLDRDAEGEQVLRAALKRAGASPALHHALGLWLVRAGRTDEALESLRLAAELGPEDPRLGYVYGVALASTGNPEAALGMYGAVLSQHPFDRDARFALCAQLLELGELDSARAQVQVLSRMWPEDPQVRQLAEQIDAAGR